MKKGFNVLAGVVVTGVVGALITKRIIKNAIMVEEYHEYFDDELEDELEDVEANRKTFLDELDEMDKQ